MGTENVGQGLGLTVITIGIVVSAIGLGSILSESSAAPSLPASPDRLIETQAPAAGPRPLPATPAVTNSSGPDSGEKAQGELKNLLEAWRKAWSSQDSAAYLAFYRPDFQGHSDTPEAWRASRKRVLEQAEFIEVTLAQVVVKLEGADQATLSFVQDYASDRREDHGNKRLQLRRSNGKWLIENEEFEAD